MGDPGDDHEEDHRENDDDDAACSEPELEMPAVEADWREECESLRGILLSRRCRAPVRVPTDDGMSVYVLAVCLSGYPPVPLFEDPTGSTPL